MLQHALSSQYLQQFCYAQDFLSFTYMQICTGTFRYNSGANLGQNIFLKITKKLLIKCKLFISTLFYLMKINNSTYYRQHLG